MYSTNLLRPVPPTQPRPNIMQRRAVCQHEFDAAVCSVSAQVQRPQRTSFHLASQACTSRHASKTPRWGGEQTILPCAQTPGYSPFSIDHPTWLLGKTNPTFTVIFRSSINTLSLPPQSIQTHGDERKLYISILPNVARKWRLRGKVPPLAAWYTCLSTLLVVLLPPPPTPPAALYSSSEKRSRLRSFSLRVGEALSNSACPRNTSSACDTRAAVSRSISAFIRINSAC